MPYAVFLGVAKPAHDEVREAPLQLLLPQFVLVAAILALSFLPKLFMEPVSAAIDPYFASTLVWEGMSLETIYGYWNPMPVLAATTAAAALLFALSWLVYRAGRGRGAPIGVARFYRFYQAAFTPLVIPLADVLWDGISHLAVGAAELVRRIYTGNGQTYLLYMLYYVVVIYVTAI